MGFVPLVLWFICVTTLLLLLTRSTLKRSKARVLEAQETYHSARALFLDTYNQLAGTQTVLPELAELVKQVSNGADFVPQSQWLTTDKLLYKRMSETDASDALNNTRMTLIATAKAMVSYQNAAKSYNDFVTTLPTVYGALLFGFKKHELKP